MKNRNNIALIKEWYVISAPVSDTGMGTPVPAFKPYPEPDAGQTEPGHLKMDTNTLKGKE